MSKTTRASIFACLLSLIWGARGLAQAPSGDKPAFDVVSIKAHTGDDNLVGGGLRRGGLYSYVNGSVLGVIEEAFGGEQRLRSSQVIGAPDWVSTARFDITGKAANANLTQREVLPMLQTLLADRFKIQVHYEKREQPVFELVKARVD